MSAYLVKPDLRPRAKSSWEGFRTDLVEIKRYNPQWLRTSLIAVAAWCAIFTGFSLGHGPSKTAATTGSKAATSAAAANTAASQLPTSSAAALVSAVHASILPSGPSGDLLPPGTMAPDRTYANNYTRGQCTWYVASRRQVPGNWGNAVSWYYHATASGWSVGTTPAVAAIAWTPAGSYGHVALVEQVSTDGKSVYVSEMNYRGVGVKSFRWAAASSFKYIY